MARGHTPTQPFTAESGGRGLIDRNAQFQTCFSEENWINWKAATTVLASRRSVNGMPKTE